MIVGDPALGCISVRLRAISSEALRRQHDRTVDARLGGPDLARQRGDGREWRAPICRAGPASGGSAAPAYWTVGDARGELGISRHAEAPHRIELAC